MANTKKKTEKAVPLDIDSVDINIDGIKSDKSKSARAKSGGKSVVTTTMTTTEFKPQVSGNARPASTVFNSKLNKGSTVSEEVVIEDVAPASGGEMPTRVASKTVSEGELLRTSAYATRALSKETSALTIKQPPRSFTVDIDSAQRFEPTHTEGLNQGQVQARYDAYLANYQGKTNSKTYANIFFGNIFSFFNILCMVVAAALIYFKLYRELSFMVIITLNITIGIVLEIRSKLAIEKLSLVTSPTAIVVRNGQKQAIHPSNVVLDDVVFLESGKQICADSVVIHGEVEANESLLTGESVPIKKAKGDLLFAGSYITSGTCFARADRVGKFNYIESLTAEAKKYQKPKSELISSLKKLINVISVFIIPLTALMVYTNLQKFDGKWAETISQSSGAAIGMIPAGMFLLTTLALSASVLRLAKRRAMVRDLYCIEMLARVDTLCLDKTGTITDGSMRVHKVIELRNDVDEPLAKIIGCMLTATEDNNQTALALAAHFGYSTQLNAKAALPFSSSRKYSAVTFENGQTYMLGAPEFILRELGPRIGKLVQEYASQGFRVLLVATAQGEIKNDYVSVARRAIALIVVEDHIRDDAPATIQWFKDNDVAVKIISGDNPLTVSEVARRVGVDNAGLYISLEGLSNQEVIEAANVYTVFGRVSPEQKALLVKSMKSQGHTVAMTGDGVNDILALKEADCSVSIASGSEAARNVSHLVLMNNSFNSMPKVVTEGRRVINNIGKSSSLYLMKTLLSIILSIAILVSTVLPISRQLTYPFSPSQLLLLEMFVIGLPSLVLSMQENKQRIQGRFIFNVISRSVPGALTLFISVMAIIVFLPHSGLSSLDFTNDTVATLLVLALTGTGFVILFRLCLPLNPLRGIMFFTVLALAVLVGRVANFYFRFQPLDLTCTMFLIIVIQAAYMVQSFFQYIVATLLNASKSSEDETDGAATATATVGAGTETATETATGDSN